MRATSDVFEIHPQIIKDKLRISKIIHKHFNPALYEKENMKAIKQLMRLDRNKSLENSTSLYKPYAKEDKGIRALLEKKKRLKKARPERSVHVKREEPLAKLILNDFRNRLEKDENLEADNSYLYRKNKVIDIMDDYYSRHIHNGPSKPDHLFMFKAKPVIPPGKILLQLEKKKDKEKIKCPKIRVGDSEVSLFSPVRGDRDKFNFDNFTSAENLNSTLPQEKEVIQVKEVLKGNARFSTIKSK